jgi:TIR domain
MAAKQEMTARRRKYKLEFSRSVAYCRLIQLKTFLMSHLAATGIVVGVSIIVEGYDFADSTFAVQLWSDLQKRGVRCWHAPEHMRLGAKIQDQIANAIRDCGRVLLVLSEHSANSKWVRHEIALAREKEKEKKCEVLLRISLIPRSRLDKLGHLESMSEILEYFALDFSKWRDSEGYRKGLEHLLAALLTNAGPSSRTTAGTRG